MKAKGMILIIVIMLIGSTNAYAASSSLNTGMQSLSQTDMEHIEPTKTHIQAINIITNITVCQAKKIAKKYIMVPGAYPGTPKLSYQKASGSFKGGYVWDVPIILNGKRVNGIMIDAQTGANLGES